MTWNEMFEKEISVNFNIAENNTESIEVDENKIIQSHSEMATNLENSSMPVEEKIDVLNGIAKCLIKFEQYEDALGYLNKSIELNIPTNSIAIEMRADIYHKLGLQLECLKDLIHFDCLNNCNANQNMAMFLLNSIVIEKTNLFIQKKGLPISKCHFEDFFRPFRSALPKNNEIATLIKRNNFRHINKVLMASDWEKYEDSRELFSVRMIRACLFFLKEMYVQALECLDTPSNILESLLKEFIMCYTHPRIPNLSLFDSKEIEERGHPTLVFFLAKLYLFSGDVEEYLRLMYTILEHPFVYYDLISFFKVSKDYYQMVECANEALEKFGNDPKWLIACGEYALITQDDEYLDSIIAQMDDEEPRSLLFKAYVYLSKKDDKELAILSLRRASALDLTCWEAYYNLGSLFYSLFTNGSESIWKNALHKASRYSEVYIAIRMLLIEEIKEYFNKE
ncbi:hypothetical protein NGRA_0204 [Nosema granulosis]|uniref:Uncharacterized protein n=1 Tax=Nosema granulosis TaxID=83296 RepID=A0A9P6H2F5_9MICR|nr:hypothetical protein NGRA_0204 [Nosema granulosis]